MPTTVVEQWYAMWLPIAVIALGFAISLVGIIYMLGSALMNDKMKGWAKLELFEIAYSAIIIVIFAAPGLGLFFVIDNVVQGAIFVGEPPEGPDVFVHEYDRSMSLCDDEIAAPEESIYHDVSACHMRLGIWYLHSIFRETSQLAFKTYVTYIYTSTMADFAINFEFITEAAGFFTFTPWRGFFTMGNTIKSMVFDYAIKIMLITKFQEVLLAFIARAAFPGLFVVGVILRTFTFTRKLGGLLLAMAFALYYIFPAFYAFGGLVMMDMKDQLRADANYNPDVCEHLGKFACEDPPITNALYLNGSVPMPGGAMKFDEYADSYEIYENKGREERMDDSEDKLKNSNPLKGFNFGKPSALSNEERVKEMDKAKKGMDDWMSDVSKINKFDRGISVAYKPGGPVDALARMAFFSIFFSLFGILATIASIRSISVTFGGDIEIAGLTHLI